MSRTTGWARPGLAMLLALGLAGSGRAQEPDPVVGPPPPPSPAAPVARVDAFSVRTLQVEARAGGGFLFTLSGRVHDSSEAVRLSLLAGAVQNPHVVKPSGQPGERRAWVWYTGGGDGWFAGSDERGGESRLQLLVGGGPDTRWEVRFELGGEEVAGGRLAVLELGPYRPVMVFAREGVELRGVYSIPDPQGPQGALLGARGRVGVFSVGAGADPAAVARELEARLEPPGELVVDTWYRAGLETVVGRAVVRDRATQPGPRLGLKLVGGARVLAVRSLDTGRPVLFQTKDDHLSLHPGPGPGPRSFEVELVGQGPREVGREILLPGLRADATRRQLAGLVALDDLLPGADGALSGVRGGVLHPDAEDVDPEVRRFWGRSGWSAYRVQDLETRLSISRASSKEVARVPDVEAETTLTSSGVRSTRMTFALPSGSVWVELGLHLPPGARAEKLFAQGGELPLVREKGVPSAGEEPRLPVRILIKDGTSGEVTLSYLQDSEPVDGTLELALPRPERRLGALSWRIEAPEGALLGRPRVLRPPGTTDATDPGGAGGGPAAGEPSAGATPGMLGSNVGAATPLPVFQSRAQGNLAFVERTEIEPDEEVGVRLAVGRAHEVLMGHAVLFLAGLLAGIWLLLGRPLEAPAVIMPAAGCLLLLAGVYLARAHELSSPWAEAVLGGVVFAALGWGVRWGLEAGPDVPAEAPPPQPPAKPTAADPPPPQGAPAG